jgi:methyl-accepting chemotaxis protein
MSTVAASGASATGSRAVDAAMRDLDGLVPDFGFAFASTKSGLESALTALRQAAPKAAALGCTTAGELSERGLTRGSVSVLLVHSDELTTRLELAQAISRNAASAADLLCAGYARAAAEAKLNGRLDSTTVALIDGLCGVGEKVVGGMMRATRPYQQVVGGAAGDEGKFQSTWVGSYERLVSDGAAALHLFGPAPWGVGVNHGLKPMTPKMRVTRASGNVVHELDGKPAFQAYRAFARSRGVELTRENAKTFLINNELGVFFLSQLARARAPLSVGDDESLTCAAEIGEGASVTILGGSRDDLVAAARAAAEEARENLRGARAAAVLLFDCICRGAILEQEFEREIAAVREVFPSTPLSGFLTYGEIARYRGRLEGWHNTTAVVVAIPSTR